MLIAWSNLWRWLHGAKSFFPTFAARYLFSLMVKDLMSGQQTVLRSHFYVQEKKEVTPVCCVCCDVKLCASLRAHSEHWFVSSG